VNTPNVVVGMPVSIVRSPFSGRFGLMIPGEFSSISRGEGNLGEGYYVELV
jgi:hypothetical protein